MFSMDMKTFLRQATDEERHQLADRVDSSVGYFYLIAGGHRNASASLCKALVAAEPKLTLEELRPDIWAPSSELPTVRRHTMRYRRSDSRHD